MPAEPPESEPAYGGRPATLGTPLLEAIGDFAAMATMVLDDQLRVVWASPATLALRSLELAGAVGRDLAVFLPGSIVTDDLRRLLIGGLVRRSQGAVELADRRLRDVAVFPVDVDGRACVGMIAVVITAAVHRVLDEYEVRESQLADAAQLGVWRLHLADGRLEGNSWYRSINDVGTPEPPRHRREMGERIHPDDVRRVNATVDAAVLSGEPYAMTYRLLGPTGVAKTVQSRGQLAPGRPGEIIGVVMDVTAAEAAARREAELQQLAALASDAERNRIAADLHDGPLQVLAAAWMRLASLERALADDDAALARVREVSTMVADTNEALRDLLSRLSSLPVGSSTADFVDEVDDLADRMRERSGIEVETHLDFGGIESLSETVLTALYRIVGEALGNAERHARASSVTVTIAVEGGAVEGGAGEGGAGEGGAGEGGVLRVGIVDDGCGFDPSAPRPSGHFGLAVMRQRAGAVGGTLEIASAPGAGTAVHARVPFDHDGGERAD